MLKALSKPKHAPQRTIEAQVPRLERGNAQAPTAPIRKFDEELQVVWGEVYAPNFPDSQNDFMTAETIREMAWNFMKKNALHNIDVQHDQNLSGSYIVESFIARADDQVFIPGSWVIGVKVPDSTLWAQIKSGELNGFSLDGLAVRKPTSLEIDLPDELTGETDEVDGHTHRFVVQFDDQGNFIGGQTMAADDGHYHEIKRGTVTEPASGHRHRFSFVEGVLNVQADD